MRRHTAWLKGMIQTVPAVATKTFVTLAQYDPPNQDTKIVGPFVVLHPSDGIDEQTRLTGPSLTLHPRFTIHSCGSTADQAAAVAEAVKAKLIVNGFGVIPVIDGDNSKRVWWHVPQPLDVDRDISPPVVFHTAEVGWDADQL